MLTASGLLFSFSLMRKLRPRAAELIRERVWRLVCLTLLSGAMALGNPGALLGKEEALQLAGWSGVSHPHGLGHVLRADVEVSFQAPVRTSPS